MMTGKEERIRKQNLGLPFYATLLVIVIILIFAFAIWIRNFTQSSEKTIEKLGEIYLMEIAERNVSNVTSTLNSKVVQMKNICKELNRDVLKDQDSVRQFISFVQRVNGIDMFALVDEDGMVYTANSTFSGISRFDFFSADNKEITYHTVDSYGTKTMILIEVPVEVIRSAGIHVVACYSGIDVEKAFATVEIQSDENKTYNCMFDKAGELLIYMTGDRSTDRNFFEIMGENAVFTESYSLQKIKDDWDKGLKGYSVYNNPEKGQSYIYYKPVPGTDWVVTSTMRESNIREAVITGNKQNRRSSIILIAVFITSISVLFSYIFFTYQKIRKEENDRETLKILGALSGDFTDIFIMDPSNDTSQAMKLYGKLAPNDKKLIRSYAATWTQYIEDVVHPDDREMVAEAVKVEKVYTALENATEYTIEYKAIVEYDIHYIQCKFVGIEGDNNRIIVGFRVIDEQKKSEERRRQILEDALIDAQKANKAKTSFLFNMSHDIRTPMNAIIGFTDLLSEHLDDKERAANYIKKIQDANDFMLSLINNVLEMARIESGKTTVDEKIWDAKSFNDTLVGVFEHQMEEKNITFTRTVNVEHTSVACDETKVREVFLNLLSNAIKYTPYGGKINMELCEIESDKPGYAFYKTEIADNGIGMSKDFLPTIFEEFSRERTTTESKISGTGLGMPIVKRLVDLMEGSIDIESVEGKGTKVTVILPHKIIEDENEFNTEETQEDITPVDLAGKRILVAEDNEINVEIVQTILEEAGLLVEIATNGAECVEMVERADSNYYDLIFMDIQMPVMNGYAATRRIRRMEDKGKAKIPILAMTANAFEEDRRNALDAGMDGHLAKPLKVKEIMDTLAKVLG